MAEYKKFNRAGGPPKRSFGGPRPQENRELHDAVCSGCGDRCQVPFRPNGKKPIYCSKCFTKDESRGPSNYSDRSDRKDFSSRPPARFNAPAPVAGGDDRQLQELKKQVSEMNATLAKLVTAVDTFNRATALTKEIRKHFPGSETSEESAPTEPKKATKKVVKAVKVAKAVKKAAKKK